MNRAALPLSLLGVLLLLPVGSACSRAMAHGSGGPEEESDAGHDAGSPDGGGFTDGGGVPDGGGPRGCQGESSLALGAHFLRPLPVTSSPLAMGCCDGAYLHLHAAELLGSVGTLMVRGWGGITEGTFDLDVDSGIYEVSLLLDNGQAFAPVAGTLTVERERAGDWSAPIFITLCGSFELEGEAGDLWIDRAVVASWDAQERFTIHLLADPAVTAVNAIDRPLDALSLAVSPLLTLNSIAWYDHREHALYGEGWQTPSEIARQLPPVGVGGLPFVLSVDGEPIYLGAFWTDLSSLVFRGPVIRQERLHGPAFFIEAGSGGLDPRDDPRILQVLRETGKLVP